jgi:hypothetical protein
LWIHGTFTPEIHVAIVIDPFINKTTFIWEEETIVEEAGA